MGGGTTDENSMIFNIFRIHYTIAKLGHKFCSLLQPNATHLIYKTDSVNNVSQITSCLCGDVSPMRKKSSYLLDIEPFTSDYTKSFLKSYFSMLSGDNSSIERVEDFKYLVATLTSQNSIQAEIKSRLKLGNACY
jgi:hypothetical protein